MSGSLQTALIRLAGAAVAQSRGGAGGSAEPSPPSRRDRRRGLSTGRAILLGAGLATAGQALARSRGPALVDSMRMRLSEQIAPDDAEVVEGDYEEYDDDEDFEDDEDFDAADEADDEDFEDDEEFDDEEREREAA